MGKKVRDQHNALERMENTLRQTVHFSSSSFIPRKKIKNKRTEDRKNKACTNTKKPI